MNREVPVANRVVQRKEVERATDFHLSKIASVKFSNFSALKAKTEARSLNKVRHPEPPKLTPLDNRNRRVRTVMHEERIREENKHMYNRLISQKPTLSSKLFAEERSRNIEFLRRIGRYPYRPNSTLVFEPEQQEPPLERSHTFGELEEASDIKISLSSLESVKHLHINSKIQEEERKHHTILLWSRVLQLHGCWYALKFQRCKNHYQIDLAAYPRTAAEHTLHLPEQVGTALLSHHDYDYEFIANKFVKFTHNAVCLAFDLKDKKKHFYKFTKRAVDPDAPASPHQPLLPAQTAGSPPLRKTVFALENEEREVKQGARPRARMLTQEIEESNLQSANDEMSGEDIVIELSKR